MYLKRAARPPAWATAGLAALLLAGCLNGALSKASDAGHLVLSVRQVQDNRGTAYIEGAVRYVRVEAWAGSSTELETPMDRSVTLDVRPGHYQVTAWERPCDGNCGNLDPATNHCFVGVDVPPRSTVHVFIRWTVPNPCQMSTTGWP